MIGGGRTRHSRTRGSQIGGGRGALVRLVAAYAVSLTGTRVSAVALPWFVLVTTGSATRTGPGAIRRDGAVRGAQGIPAALTGRVLALVHAAAWAGIPLGGLLGGPLTGTVGITAALVICGTAYLIAIAGPATQAGWREMDRPPVELPPSHRQVTTPS